MHLVSEIGRLALLKQQLLVTSAHLLHRLSQLFL
jgi:hypothetical protein